MNNSFRKIAARTSTLAGKATTFLLAIIIVVVWAFTGPVFHYSDTWQLVINTGTTIITFLMVFLIQNTQNRDGKAVQIKLDELLRATKGAHLSYIGLEDFSDDDLAELDKQFRAMTQNPSSLRSLQRLHEKIEAEHSRRRGLPFTGRRQTETIPTPPKPDVKS
jgi:low affinity Fe/Cu permease